LRVRRGAHCELVDLTEPARERAELRHTDALRQLALHRRHPLLHALAGTKWIRTRLDHGRDRRDAIAKEATSSDQTLQAPERRLHGTRHPELHLLGREPRCLREDDDLTPGDVRQRVEAQPATGDDPEDGQHRDQDHHQQPMAHGPRHQRIDHGGLPPRGGSAATSSPSCKGPRTRALAPELTATTTSTCATPPTRRRSTVEVVPCWSTAPAGTSHRPAPAASRT